MTTIEDFAEDGYYQKWKPIRIFRTAQITKAQVNLDALNNVVKQLDRRLKLLEERRPRRSLATASVSSGAESKHGGGRKKRRRRTKRKRTKRKRHKKKSRRRR